MKNIYKKLFDQVRGFTLIDNIGFYHANKTHYAKITLTPHIIACKYYCDVEIIHRNVGKIDSTVFDLRNTFPDDIIVNLLESQNNTEQETALASFDDKEIKLFQDKVVGYIWFVTR